VAPVGHFLGFATVKIAVTVHDTLDSPITFEMNLPK
jgi:hypothetical protein